jgi:enoyl-CoA hydratase/carnithine racemase
VFVDRGLPLEGAAAYLLTRSLSPVRARGRALFGNPVDGRTAAEWGPANRCVPDDELPDFAGNWARRLAAGPSIGIGHVRGQVDDVLEQTMEQVAEKEVPLLGPGIGSDATKAVQAFVERREPRFTAMELAGRIVANAPPAVGASKRIALGLRDGTRPAEQLHGELTRESAHAIADSAGAKEGVRAFLEKRPPVWSGR